MFSPNVIVIFTVDDLMPRLFERMAVGSSSSVMNSSPGLPEYCPSLLYSMVASPSSGAKMVFGTSLTSNAPDLADADIVEAGTTLTIANRAHMNKVNVFFIIIPPRF